MAIALNFMNVIYDEPASEADLENYCKGFNYAYAECTNVLSEKVMHKNKFDTIYKYACKDCGLKMFEQIEGDFALTVKKLR